MKRTLLAIILACCTLALTAQEAIRVNYNASKEMTYCEAPGFDVEYGTEDGAWVSYALPSVGKDITVTYWYKNDETKQKTLKWDGNKFSF